MSIPLNLFIFAKMGAGKDAASEYLAHKYGLASVALADGIRREIQRNEPSYVPKSNRALEIDLGMKYREWFGRNVWCDKALISLTVERKTNYAKGGIIRDGRFENEYRYFVEARGFTPVKIVAPDEVRIERLKARDGAFNAKQFYSPSDCEIITWDGYTVTNDGTLDAFYAQLDALVDELRREDAA